ncbi:aminoglycoside phosphotransferase family protein [Lentimicrobium sp. S6]|uniref:aminoglycoside phosphotransferase family protein n=1 Tax=Lentimicrobium sp. S6 TaxID=2735872 RepID=UPI001556CF35|nr:phosphotransferase [Lentimicrobium sp. S6]NPD44978.1 phosphotransferase [Lentimicrobium sp. S6]
MIRINTEILISKEYQNWQSKVPERIEVLNSGSASSRHYFRLYSGDKTIIATYSTDIRENEAFFYLADYFRQKGIRIPEVYYISEDRCVYLQQDIGDLNLLNYLKSEGLTTGTKQYYKESLEMLMKMQLGARELDYSKCYPRASFDEQSIIWDLNYFKYYFLKVSGVEFDEQLLEDDFQFLAQDLAINELEPYFMFRDFQARNIHIHKGEVWFIDFQGGRRGPMLYDLASLLYQASANLPNAFRKQCLDDYFMLCTPEISQNRMDFDNNFKKILLIRIVQTLGAYGFRGLIEGKPYFKNSIPNALDNLQRLLVQMGGDDKISYFLKILADVVQIKNNFEN